MTDQHPITPPPELVRQIRSDAQSKCDGHLDCERRMIYSAFRAGADQELEACCEILRDEFNYHHLAEPLRAARRPQPQPSLKEQALAELHHLVMSLPGGTTFTDATIRRALELVPEGPAVTPPADDRGPGSVTPDNSPVAKDSGRLIIAQALTAEADSNDDSAHLVWITSHELRRAAAILRDDVLTQFTPPEPAAAPDRPLWDQMSDTMHDASSVPEAMAAALRVVADWIEQRHLQTAVVFADLLRAEAERAEAGE